MMKIMIDTCIYDKLYEKKEIANKLINLVNTGKITLYGTAIQKSQIAENKKEKDKDKVEWSLYFSSLYVHNASAPFCWDVDGAGWDQGTWITKDQEEIFNQIKPNSKEGNHIADRAIAVAKLECDIFVTEDKDLRTALRRIMQGKKIYNWDEFELYIFNFM